MEKLVILMCLFAAIVALPTQDWNTFKMIHSKKYQNDREEKSRMNIFLEHQNEVNKHNEMYEKGLISYKMILNAFSDMTNDEFAKQKNGFNHPGEIQLNKTIQSSVLLKLPSIALPKSVDWRDKGAVTDVKDQLDCGSCWAFSTVGVLEGQYFLKHGRLQSLSAQNLVDCAKTQRNKCSGFQRHAAFDYIKRNGGIETDKSYPYKGYGGSCKYSKRDNSGVTLRDYEYIPEGDEEKLQAAIASKGPISVSIDASHKSFQFYSSGIYYEPKCNSNNLDHAVLVVGYGTDKNGREYYIVKNSYGQKWGENGYARLARNRKNHCGIASSAVYPVL